MPPSSPPPLQPSPSGRDAFEGGETVRVPIVEERLTVERTVVESGTVQLHQRVETHAEPVTLDHVHETVDVERRLVGEVVPEARAPYREGDVLVIPLYDERVVLQRQLVLREEVRVRVDRAVTPETVEVLLRRAVLDVERRSAPPPSTASEDTPPAP